MHCAWAQWVVSAHFNISLSLSKPTLGDFITNRVKVRYCNPGFLSQSRKQELRQVEAFELMNTLLHLMSLIFNFGIDMLHGRVLFLLMFSDVFVWIVNCSNCIKNPFQLYESESGFQLRHLYGFKCTYILWFSTAQNRQIEDKGWPSHTLHTSSCIALTSWRWLSRSCLRQAQRLGIDATL